MGGHQQYTTNLWPDRAAKWGAINTIKSNDVGKRVGFRQSLSFYSVLNNVKHSLSSLVHRPFQRHQNKNVFKAVHL